MDNIECRYNREMQEDIEEIAGQFPFADELKGSVILVTGATGLLGSQVVGMLACLNRLQHTDIKIIAFARNKEKAERMFGHLAERGDVHIRIGDINAPLPDIGKINYIIHGASATSSKYFVTNPVETIKTAMDGTTNILEYAKQQMSLKGVLYLSSLEVYGTPAAGKKFITETDYGYIDPTSVRSSYSEGKRMVECLCASYAKEYQVPVKIARLSQTFGPGVEYNDGRVFAEFTRCALEQRDIVLHTQGNTVRTYCYTKDAVNAMFYILLRGNAGEAYNVSNMETAISIREMAELVCKEIGDSHMSVRIEIPEDIGSFGYNPEMIVCLDTTKLETLGWHATTDLKTMFLRMSKGMKRRNDGR